MVYIICIGMYNSKGNFNSENWRDVVQWLRKNCDSLIVYSKAEYNKLKNNISDLCDIKSFSLIEPQLNVFEYRILIQNQEFWNKFANMNFSIDHDYFSHIYFFSKKIHIASMEITNYNNFFVLEKISENKIDTTKIIRSIDENILICRENKDDIDLLVDGEEWKAYGDEY